MAGSGVTLYSTTAAGNKTVIGTIDWREDIYMPSQINDNLAQIMADIRALANTIGAGWVEVGDGDGIYTATYLAPDQFRIDGVDVTGFYRAGMRVRVLAPTPGQVFGTITAVNFSTHTNLTVAWDFGMALSNEAITAVYLGVGSGDTTNPDLQQAAHACRLVYADATTIRLERYGGCLLTIDNIPRLIPVAGVSHTVISGYVGVNPLYIYARMSSGTTMVLEGRSEAPIYDNRNGLPVHPTDAAITLVGMAYVRAGPTMLDDGARQAVSSFWNRLPRGYGFQQTNTTTSTTIVPLHSPIEMLIWSDSVFNVHITGYASLSTTGITFVQPLMNGGAVGQGQAGYYSVANAQLPLATAIIGYGTTGPHSFQLGGYVGAGTGTFTATIYGTVQG